MASKSSKLEIQVDAETAGAIKDLDRVADAVGDISAAAADAGSALGSISAGAADAASAAGDSFGGIVPVFDVVEVLGAVKDLAIQAGELFADQLSSAMDFEAGQDKLQGQLGATAEEAEHLGQLAGDLYSEAFGESMDQVNDVMRRVIQNLGTDAMDPALKQLTSGVLDIVNVFEQDASRVTIALGNLVKTGLVKDGVEGLDLLVRGFQEGADNADDFLDSIVEFSTDFRQLGLTGAQSVGLMIQALKNGARDTDKLADALAEWRKLSVDTTDDIRVAYRKLGLDADKVAQAIGKGGKESADAFKATLDAIRNLEDPAEKLRLTLQLFGTPGEDLAQAFTNIDLSKAVEELGTVKDAASDLSTTVASNADATWTSFKRSLEINVVQFLADNVIPSLTTLGEHAKGVFAAMGTAWDNFIKAFKGEEQEPTEDQTLITIREFGEEARKFSDEWTPKLIQAWRDIQREAENTARFLRENKEIMELLGVVVTGVLVAALLALVAALLLVGTMVAIVTGTILLLASPMIAVSGVLKAFGKTWFDVWNAALSVIQFVGRQIGEVIETIEDAIGGLIRTLESFASRPWDFLTNIPGLPRSVAPSISPVTLMGPQALAVSSRRPAPVFNVTIAHSGLAVDSPRLQREIVDALRRWEKREGPLRGLRV